MNIVIPIGRKRFYYNRKVNCLPAVGWLDRDGVREELRSGECLGNMGLGTWRLGVSLVLGVGERLRFSARRHDVGPQSGFWVR